MSEKKKKVTPPDLEGLTETKKANTTKENVVNKQDYADVNEQVTDVEQDKAVSKSVGLDAKREDKSTKKEQVKDVEQDKAVSKSVGSDDKREDANTDDTGDTGDTEQALEQYAAKTLSPSRLVVKRFFRSKLSVVGLSMIVFLILFAFIGPLFSPWSETEIDETPAPGPVVPFRIEFTGLNEQGEPTEYIIYDLTSDTLSANLRARPSLKHWLGTDKNGRDVLTRLMYGGRVSLIIGFSVVFLSTFIGVIFGSLAGYFGKWVDQTIMRIVDIINCIPTLPLLLIASAVYDAWDKYGYLDSLKALGGIGEKLRIAYLIVILVALGWSGTARIVRGQILSLREQEYMIAGESLGLSARRKIFRHLVPNIMPQLIVAMTLSLGSVILYEATLSWLNLGVPMPYAAWGQMISAASDPDILQSYLHIWVPPGLCLMLAVLGFNFVGDGLRDAFDPKMKR